MAEALFNSKTALHRASSAGIAAFSGAPASGNAVGAMRRRGIDLSGHRARAVTADMLSAAGRIYCMSPAHRRALLEGFPGLKTPVYVLDPPIPDPYGGSADDYERTAAALSAAADKIIAELDHENTDLPNQPRRA